MFVLRVVTTGCQQHPHGYRGHWEYDVRRHACLDSTIHTWSKSCAKGGGNALGLYHSGVHCCKRCEATHLGADGDCDTANNSSCCLACACRTLGIGGGRLRALTLVRCHFMSIPVGDTRCPSLSVTPGCPSLLVTPSVPHSPYAQQCWVGPPLLVSLTAPLLGSAGWAREFQQRVEPVVAAAGSTQQHAALSTNGRCHGVCTACCAHSLVHAASWVRVCGKQDLQQSLHRSDVSFCGARAP